MIDVRISSSMSNLLARVFSKDDIIAALDSMHPCKSPGLDGFVAYFFK